MSWGKVITIFLILLTLYSGLSILTPNHKKLTINDIEIPNNKRTEYLEIIKKVKQEKERNTKINKEEASPKKMKNNTDQFNIVSNEDILFKLKSYKIQNDNLIINAYLYNKGTRSLNKTIYIVCVAYSDNEAVDQFSWRKNMKINSKETLLLEDMNFGYATAGGFDNLKCKLK